MGVDGGRFGLGGMCIPVADSCLLLYVRGQHNVCRKQTQYCKAIIFQLKINLKRLKKNFQIINWYSATLFISMPQTHLNYLQPFLQVGRKKIFQERGA